jgi:hypothetical protein
VLGEFVDLVDGFLSLGALLATEVLEPVDRLVNPITGTSIPHVQQTIRPSSTRLPTRRLISSVSMGRMLTSSSA